MITHNYRPKSTIQPWHIVTLIAISIVAMVANMGFISFDIRSKAQLVPANIAIDTLKSGPPIDRSFFRAFAQGGEEATNMFSGIESEIAMLKPTYIRIDHIYDYYNIVSRSNRELVFRFNDLDVVLDSIRKTGATPFISLSYMPPTIAQDGHLINMPINWEEWAWVVQQTIEHISGTNGKNIPNVYYEVWNEPDHPQFGGWKTYSAKNYLTLYHYASIGATRATGVQPFKLGGPSTTALYSGWINALAKTRDRVDFFSWHLYTDTPQTYVQNLTDIRTWLNKFGRSNPELSITEFGFSPEKNPKWAGSIPVAHTAAVIRALLDAPPTHLFSFEIIDGPLDTGDAGWGMWTHKSRGTKPKPRVALFPLLARMDGGRLSVTGEGSRVTAFATQNNEYTRIFLTNYDINGGGESFPLTIYNLPPGTYQLRYVRLGEPDQLVTETVTADPWTKQFFMKGNSILLLEVKKL